MATNPVFAVAQAKHDVLVNHFPAPSTGSVQSYQVPLDARLAGLNAVMHPGIHHQAHPVHHPNVVPQQAFVVAPQHVQQPHPHIHHRQYVEVAKTEAFHDILHNGMHRRLDDHNAPVSNPTGIALASRRQFYQKVFGF
ncbi:hypothetical protein GUITHDRAFT_153060 [Guillardia theta CCMP2712]|uniref:Uncharacterized protein n=2 Tax=Guillardia theta TaxID=55529 RepID=L1J6E5_GUITC|nr:hypothetical protein GUITHDRAFT_153060 [Guillardia theta CCMP2712]EKX44113.1 hypothetical protein GUITHDRAFT_153060 [Guillardia theta CCMP2712]|eukprot:XP_005831093.1 hypothetical protein GUITHDRAFT_153060 [Guillardia theta CCMP2712]